MYQNLADFLSKGQYLGFVITIGLGLLLNAAKILTFVDGLKKRRIGLLKEASSLPSINGSLKNHFEDEIEGEYFRHIYKVKMDKGIRDACIALYTRAERRLPFLHFLRARPHIYLRHRDGKLYIKISTFDKVGYYYNYFFGTAAFLFGVFYLARLPTIKEPSILGIIIVCSISLFFILFGLFMLSQTFSVVSAKKIRKFLDEDKKLAGKSSGEVY